MNNLLSQNLKKYRLAKNLTQEQAAEKLNVSPQTVSRWECCTTLPDVTKLPEIARLYSVTIDDLFQKNTVAYENYAQRLASVYEASRKIEDFFQAEQEFKKLISAGGYSMDDLRTYGIMHQFMMMDCKEKALYWFDRTLAECTEEDCDILRRTRAQKLRLRALMGEAETCVEEQKKALDASGGSSVEWVLMLVAYLHANQYEDAYECYQKAAELFPEEWELHIHGGSACRKLGLYDEAFSCWEQAERLRPTYVDVKYEKAFCYADMGLYDKAYQMHLEIAEALAAEGLEVEAAAELQRANLLINQHK